MTVQIRFSRKEDFQALMKIDNSIWTAANTPAVISWSSVKEYAEKNPAGSQLVAEKDGLAVGYLGFRHPTPLKTNQHVWELDIAVDERLQGEGIGKRLLKAGVKVAKENGITKLSLRVLSSNESAIQFYKRCGFIEQGRLINEFFIDGQYVDDLLMYMSIL